MKCSVIICTRNRAESLRQTLAQFRDVQPTSEVETEIIIADNGSSDATRAVVESADCPFELRYVFEPERGQVMARHAGIAESRGEVIVFTDDDVRPEPQWLQEITRPVLDAKFDAMAGTVRIAPHLLRRWMTPVHRGWLTSTESIDPDDPQGIVGANMAFSRRVLERVPRFDPELGPGRMGFWDDSLFSFQLKRAGYRIGMARRGIVEHHFDPSRLSRKAFLERAEGEGRCEAYVSWHWRHDHHSRPALRAKWLKTKLALKRVLTGRSYIKPEGMDLWEIGLIRWAAFFNQYAIEQCRPHAYSQYGLRKLDVANELANKSEEFLSVT